MSVEISGANTGLSGQFEVLNKRERTKDDRKKVLKRSKSETRSLEFEEGHYSPGDIFYPWQRVDSELYYKDDDEQETSDSFNFTFRQVIPEGFKNIREYIESLLQKKQGEAVACGTGRNRPEGV